MSTKRQQFIEYLDSYKWNEKLEYFEYIQLSVAIQTHYDPLIETHQPSWLFQDNIVPMTLAPVELHSPIVAPMTVAPRQTLTIDASMQTLSDMLDIIRLYDYDDKIDYNIDLKALHNIKSELEQLNQLIGMDALKQSILSQLIYFIQELHVGNDFKHTVLYGPPGTGKTEVAKIIGNMYSKLGILSNNIFKKVTRTDLIAGYLGQTAIKTRKVIDECLGGVLFIDEAYSLGSSEQNDLYSKECVDTICEALSDHKNNLMVIIAGYEKELNETFFAINKGMDSRFIWRFTTNEYNPKELSSIFNKMVSDQGWNLSDDLVSWFEQKKDMFGAFGRDMELLLTYSKIAHGRRIYGKDKYLRKILTLVDINAGFETFSKNKKKEDKPDNTFMHSIYV